MAKKAAKTKAAKRTAAKKVATKKAPAKKAAKKAPAKKTAAKATKKAAKKAATKKTAQKSVSGLKTRFRVNPKKRIGKLPKLKSVKSRIGTTIKIRKIRNKDIIVILDFGSQYKQLIARRTRENKVYSKIVPYNITPEEIQEIKPKGIILSGGPLSVYDENAPRPNPGIFDLDIPVLGICYGMQVITEIFNGKVKKSQEREFGRAELFIDSNKDLFQNLPSNLTCWMSHSDELKKMPDGFVKLAHTLNADCAAFANRRKKIYGVQFHPEVVHTQRGEQILNNFVFSICGSLRRRV